MENLVKKKKKCGRGKPLFPSSQKLLQADVTAEASLLSLAWGTQLRMIQQVPILSDHSYISQAIFPTHLEVKELAIPMSNLCIFNASDAYCEIYPYKIEINWQKKRAFVMK